MDNDNMDNVPPPEPSTSSEKPKPSKAVKGKGITSKSAKETKSKVMDIKEKGRIRFCSADGTLQKPFLLRKRRVSFGKADSCDLTLKDIKGLGDEHCLITFDIDGKAFIEPVYKSGLTYVNGDMIFDKKRLNHQDVVTIVKKSFTFYYPPSARYSRQRATSASTSKAENSRKKVRPTKAKSARKASEKSSSRAFIENYMSTNGWPESLRNSVLSAFFQNPENGESLQNSDDELTDDLSEATIEGCESAMESLLRGYEGEGLLEDSDDDEEVSYESLIDKFNNIRCKLLKYLVSYYKTRQNFIRFTSGIGGIPTIGSGLIRYPFINPSNFDYPDLIKLTKNCTDRIAEALDILRERQNMMLSSLNIDPSDSDDMADMNPLARDFIFQTCCDKAVQFPVTDE